MQAEDFAFPNPFEIKITNPELLSKDELEADK
jgi:hypothetical protein